MGFSNQKKIQNKTNKQKTNNPLPPTKKNPQKQTKNKNNLFNKQREKFIYFFFSIFFIIHVYANNWFDMIIFVRSDAVNKICHLLFDFNVFD